MKRTAVLFFFIILTSFAKAQSSTSGIDIPLQIALKPIYLMAEKMVDTVFTSANYPNDWVQADCATRYKYKFRRMPLRMSMNGNNLNLLFTGLYQIIGSSRACVGTTVVSPWTPDCSCGFGEGARRVEIGFGAKFKLNPNYILQTTMVRTEPKALDKCTVCFWGQDITATVLEGLKKELDASKKAMEDSFSIINLRPYMQQAWNKLNEPYPIPGIGYLSLNPQKLHMENLIARNDILNVNIGIAASPAISFIKPDATISSIPNLSAASSKDGFTINLEAALQYDSLSKVVESYMSGKRFDLSEGLIKKHIVVQRTNVSGDASGSLVIKVDFTGSFSGAAYFIGKPVYNAATQTIEVENLDYDLRTQNLFLKTAKWLFNKRITYELKKYTSFSLGGYFETASQTLNASLNKEWTKGITGRGAITELKLNTVKALPEHLLINSTCTGKLAITVTEINLKF